jgi:hypothetical protein
VIEWVDRLFDLRRAAVATGTAALLFLTVGSGPILADTATVECGQLAAYTAPDPSGPTDGSLTLGLSSTWDILATATISPAATTALPSGGGNGPTCLALGLDGSGKVTSIDFAPHGTISGPVTFDSGSGYYILADRLIIPTSVTDAYPALAGLFVTSYQAGSTLAIAFDIDMTTGGFTGFNGHAAFCGKASPVKANVAKVGKATLPASILSAAAKAALVKAAGDSVCATVHSTGTIDSTTGAISTSAVVAIKPTAATATPPATASALPQDAVAPSSNGALAWLGLLIGAAVATLVALARRGAGRTTRGAG